MNATISIFDPTNVITVPYDPATDTGGYSTPLLLVTTKARFTPLRRPVEGTAGEAWLTKRPGRFQVPLSSVPARPFIKGLIVRVTVCPKFPEALQFSWTVLTAISSSDAAVCTIECLSELTITPPVA